MSPPVTPRGPAKVSVTAFFESEEAVVHALERLVRAGVPRDVVEVVVSRTAAERFFRGRARARGRETLRGAGMGAVIGLLAGGVVGISVVALPGFAPPGLQAVAQLIGPNAGSLLGAGLGAAIGAMTRQRPGEHDRRALERDAILLVVQGRPPGEAARIEKEVLAAGGTDVRVG